MRPLFVCGAECLFCHLHSVPSLEAVFCDGKKRSVKKKWGRDGSGEMFEIPLSSPPYSPPFFPLGTFMNTNHEVREGRSRHE